MIDPKFGRALIGALEEAVSTFRSGLNPGQAASGPPPTGAQPDSSTLVLLRRIDERTARMEERLTGLERQIVRLATEVADLRIESLDQRSRLERIERRLDLREGA